MAKRKDNKGVVLKDGESYRDKEKRYSFRWTSKDGKRHSVYAKTLKELREKEEQIQHDLYDGIRVEDKNVTINDLYEMWKIDKKGLKSSTRGNYFYMYEHYVMNDFGKRKVQTVKKFEVRRFYNKLHEDEDRPLAFNTLDIIHNVLYQIFELAVEDNYIRTNPTEKTLEACKKAHEYEAPKRHALTITEQTAFIEFIRDTPQYRHWLPLFTVFLGTGCRVSEIVGLRWKDVNMKENYISINHGISYYQRETNECYFAVSTPKTKAGTRIIPMLKEVKQALLDEKSFQKECGIKCEVSYDGYTDFIFLNRFGNVHNPQTINRAIKRIIFAYNKQEFDKAEKENREPLLLPNFSCHNLRHTFATRYCENETNLKVIQEILGHKDIATTMEVYVEATKEKKLQSFTELEGKIRIS